MIINERQLSENLFKETSRINLSIATRNSKAYYMFTKLLKEMGINYNSININDDINRGTLILTTTKEKKEIKANRIITIEELSQEITTNKELIISSLYNNKEDTMVVGIDPGEKIGISIYLKHYEIYSNTFNSVEVTVDNLSKIIKKSKCSKKIIRVGTGFPKIGKQLIKEIFGECENIEIEQVDESGTSSLGKNKFGKKGTRDQYSARIIAFRVGKEINVKRLN